MKKFFITFLSIVFTQFIWGQKITDYLTPIPKEIFIEDNEFFENYSHEELIEFSNHLRNYHKGTILVHQHHGLFSHHFEMNIDESFCQPQSYQLNISKHKISIKGGDEAGLFYGICTLLQVVEYSIDNNRHLPCLTINDQPDFERRGLMLDISRNKVPTLTTLCEIIDLLASWKINELQLYTEHTFAYKNHKEVWEHASPMTADEIHIIDQYCQLFFIDLVPNQNSFGHMENWLKYDTYLELAECPTDCKTKWGIRNRTSLDPTNPKSLELMKELYAELLPNFTSRYFNIGCDETVELGLGRSKALCDSLGSGTIYLNYVKQLNKEVNHNGKLAQFWGDVIISHPDLIGEIPKNMTAMAWGYDRNYQFNKELPQYKNSGIDFYVCPGTSTWRSLIGKNSTAFANIYNAANNGKIYGAKGLLNTNWGDYGHWQPLSVCYPGILIGASYAWNCDTSALNNLEFQLNHYLFKDPTGNTAKALLKLGNAYLAAKIPEGVANVFHLMLHRYQWTMNGNYQTKEMKIPGLQAAEKEIDEALNILSQAKPKCEDSEIVINEILQAANLAKHAIHLGIARLNVKDNETKSIDYDKRQALAAELRPLIDNQKKLWIVRNREGGLDESISNLENLYNYYLEK